jgi:hypothetical protein
MPYQRVSRTQPAQVGKETPSLPTLSSRHLPEQALEDEKECSLERLFSRQTALCLSSFAANHEPSFLAPNHRSKLVLKEEQALSIKRTFSPQTNYCCSPYSHEPTSHASNPRSELALERDKNYSLKRPFSPQTTLCSSSSLAPNRISELALEEEKEGCSFKRPFNPHNARYEPTLRLTNALPELALEDKQDTPTNKTKCQIMRKARGKTGFVTKSALLLLLMMASIFSVVNAQTDCKIMHDWLPKNYTEVGTSCCEQFGITCSGGRIEYLYVNFNSNSILKCVNPSIIDWPDPIVAGKTLVPGVSLSR